MTDMLLLTPSNATADAFGVALEYAKHHRKTTSVSRSMDRVAKETKARRFNERDIRAKVGSDAETIEEAQHVLGLADREWRESTTDESLPTHVCDQAVARRVPTGVF
jgi:hypothetical protein